MGEVGRDKLIGVTEVVEVDAIEYYDMQRRFDCVEQTCGVRLEIIVVISQ
jgi:hypothetical protein